MGQQTIKDRLMNEVRQWALLDLRLSHLIVAGAILIGAIINLLLPHGWTIWPMVLAFGILTYMNEAVSRSGQGIPPLQVYAFFIGAGVAWFVAVLLIMSINPLILILGLAAFVYRISEAILKKRERDRLIAKRRADGVCLHCGGPYDPNAPFCETCGEEPNPDVAILKRVAQIYRSPQDISNARAVLAKTATPSTAASKEQALLDRHRTGKVTAPASLPKAAKLGPSSTSRRQR